MIFFGFRFFIWGGWGIDITLRISSFDPKRHPKSLVFILSMSGLASYFNALPPYTEAQECHEFFFFRNLWFPNHFSRSVKQSEALKSFPKTIFILSYMDVVSELKCAWTFLNILTYCCSFFVQIRLGTSNFCFRIFFLPDVMKS